MNFGHRCIARMTRAKPEKNSRPASRSPASLMATSSSNDAPAHHGPRPPPRSPPPRREGAREAREKPPPGLAVARLADGDELVERRAGAPRAAPLAAQHDDAG